MSSGLEWLESLVQVPRSTLFECNEPQGKVEQAPNISEDTNTTLESLFNETVSALDAIILRSAEFQADIGTLSCEMAELDSLSSSLHNRLAARDAALAKLRPALADLTLPRTIVEEIWRGEIDPQWRASLALLEGSRNSGSASNAQREATKLRRALLARAAERSKDYWVSHLRTLRRPGVDAQSIQSELINNASLYIFLNSRVPRLASTLKQAYSNTMKWYYTMLFGKYGRWMSRQPLHSMDVQPIGSQVGSDYTSGFFYSSYAKSGPTSNSESYSIGSRPSVLSQSSSISIPLGGAASQKPYFVEALTASLLVALSNSIESEEKMGTIVFEESSPAYIKNGEFFDVVFKQYSALILKWIEESSDAFALLMIIRLLQNHCTQASLSEFKEALLHPAWIRLETVMAQHTRSIESAAMKPSVRSSSNSNIGPHHLTQLCSSLLSGILQLCPTESSQEEPVATAVRQLAEAYELFITKMSTDETVRYTNYFMVHALLSDVKGPLAESLANHFNLLVAAYAKK